MQEIASDNETVIGEKQAAGVPAGSWLAAGAPWHAHLLFLVPGVATAAYINQRGWGIFETLPWIVALIVAMAGWFAWSIAWSILSVGSIGVRLIYWTIGLVGLLATVLAVTGWPDSPDQLALGVGHLGIGWALPMVLVRRRGWHLARVPRPAAEGSFAKPPSWQFSIGDVLVLMAGLSIFLGLLLASESYSWQEVVLEALVLLSGTVILLVGLSWRSIWWAAIVSVLFAAAIYLVSVGVLNPESLTQPKPLLLAAMVFGPTVGLLLAAIGLVRSCGYRLQKSNGTRESSD
jgi:hypothetical protein